MSLPTKADIKRYEEMTGLKWDYTRQTGRSTALAFQAIADAMRNPGYWVRVVDHVPTHQADRQTLDRVERIVEELGMQGFHFHITTGECYVGYAVWDEQRAKLGRHP